MNIKPLGKRIVVKAIEKELQTASGIVLTGVAETERPERGEVIASSVPEIEAGTTVMFDKYLVNEVENEGKKYLIIEAENVLCSIS